MKKILFIATVPNFITGFLTNNFEILHSMGIEIHVATNFNVESKREFLPYVIKHHIDIQRNPIKKQNIRAYKELLKIIKINDINVVDCHTPMGGLLGRLVAKRLNLKCIYTAHGFHFFKAAPFFNWVMYYPIEKYLSRYTDILVTINKEDYDISKRKFTMKSLKYIPGVGVDTKKFSIDKFNRDSYRALLGYTSDDFIIFSAGELNKNKNHEVIIKAIALLKNPKIKYMIAGKGQLNEYLLNLATELNVKDQVQLLGYRKDIVELNNCSDIFAFPSKREGLGLAAIEAMASGLPIITSNTRGINDYSINGKTGFKCCADDISGFAKAINELYNNNSLRNEIKEFNKQKAEEYKVENVFQILVEVYRSIN